MNKPPIKRKDQGFYIQSEMWHSGVTSNPDYLEEITFGDFANNGTEGTLGEMKMVWVELGGESTPKLLAYADSWFVLASYADIIEQLGKTSDRCITPSEFTALLIEHGFKDLTERVSPYDFKPEESK